jgi:hypothetical protein
MPEEIEIRRTNLLFIIDLHPDLLGIGQRLQAPWKKQGQVRRKTNMHIFKSVVTSKGRSVTTEAGDACST